ncbi:hypothetical protein Y032_0252g217 [Ancylostoma ceylanicum]|uniref:Uncharacterized protein n=1 Tax=Ancylostoma ceylanicum TaxID=53326 RepID=A0A016SCK9_9BILA|nr:hypothetical protein Y032_0252g217 [Ancylostoma ceylanicum]
MLTFRPFFGDVIRQSVAVKSRPTPDGRASTLMLHSARYWPDWPSGPHYVRFRLHFFMLPRSSLSSGICPRMERDLPQLLTEKLQSPQH